MFFKLKLIGFWHLRVKANAGKPKFILTAPDEILRSYEANWSVIYNILTHSLRVLSTFVTVWNVSFFSHNQQKRMGTN